MQHRNLRLVQSKLYQACRHRLLWWAFSGWTTDYFEWQWRQHILCGACERLIETRQRRRLVSGIFRNWKDSIFNLKQHAIQNIFVLHQEEIRKRTRIAASFSGWREQAQKQPRSDNVFQKALYNLKRRTTARAFQSWNSQARQQRRHSFIVLRLMNHALSVALAKWRKHAMAQKRGEGICARILTSLKLSTKVWVLKGWHTLALKSRRFQDKYSRTLSRLLKDTLHLAFVTWSEGVPDKSRMIVENNVTQAKVRMLMLRFKSKGLVSCLNFWSDNVVERRRLKAKTYKVVLRMLDRMLVTSLDLWKQYTVDQKTMQRKMTALVFSMLNSTLKQAFRTWCHSTSVVQVLRDKMVVIICRLKFRRLVSAFETWQRTVEDLRVLDVSAARIVRRLQYRGLSASFEIWWHASAHLRIFREKHAVILCRLRNRGLVMAFESWLHKTQILRLLHEKHAAFLHRLQTRELLTSLHAWSHSCHVQTVRRVKAAIVFARWGNRRKCRVFAAWNELVQSGRYDSALQSRMRDVTKNISTAVRIMSRWRSAIIMTEFVRNKAILLQCRLQVKDYTSRVFFGWNEFVLSISLRRVQLGKCCTRNEATVVMSEWKTVVSKLRHARESAKEMWGYFKVSTLVFGLEEWKMTHAIRKQLRARLLRAKHTVSALKITGKQEHWNAIAREEKRLRFKMIKCVMRLLHPGLSGALQQWIGVVYAAHDARDAAVSSLQQVALLDFVSVIGCWRNFANEARLSKEKLLSAASRREIVCLNLVLKQWKEAATIWMRRRRLHIQVRTSLAKIVHHQHHLPLSKYLHAWADFAQSTKNLRDAVSFLVQRAAGLSLSWIIALWNMQASRISVVCTRIVALQERFRVRTLNLATRVWRQVTLQNCAERMRVVAIELKMLRYRLQLKWNMWCSFLDVRRELDRNEPEKRICMLNSYWARKVQEIFEMWKQATENRKYLYLAYKRLFLQQFDNMVSRIFNWMKINVKFAVKMRRAVQKIVLKRQNLCLALAMALWVEQCRDWKRMRRAAYKIVSRRRKLSLAPAIARWVAHHREGKHMQRAAGSIIIRSRKMCQAPALLRWSEHHQQEKLIRRAAQKIVLRWRKMCLTSALMKWEEKHEEEKLMRRATRRVVQVCW